MAKLTLCDICGNAINGMEHRVKLMKANGSVEGRYDYSDVEACDDCWRTHLNNLFEQGDGPK